MVRGGCLFLRYNVHMDTVYIETSIVSHASAWTSSNIQVAAVQHQAREWWAFERPKFNVVTSQLTINEALVIQLLPPIGSKCSTAYHWYHLALMSTHWRI